MITSYRNPRLYFAQILILLSSFFSVLAADGSVPEHVDIYPFGNVSRIIVGIVCILVGLFFVFSGESFLKVILFIGGATLFGILSFLLARWFVEDISTVSDTKRITIYASCAIVALIGGFTALCCFQLGLLVLGGLLGFVLANFLIRTNVLSGHTNQMILIACFVIVFGVLTLCLSELIITIATAFIGATVTMHGIDMFALTGFSYYLFSLKDGGKVAPTDTKVWIMLVSVFALAAVGILVQFRRR